MRDCAEPEYRSPEDLAVVRQAICLLAADIRTEHLGVELGRTHSLPGWSMVPGWKFLKAAQIVTSPTVSDAKRGKWAYYVAVVKNLTDAERNPEPSRLSPAQQKARDLRESLLGRKAAEPHFDGDDL